MVAKPKRKSKAKHPLILPDDFEREAGYDKMSLDDQRNRIAFELSTDTPPISERPMLRFAYDLLKRPRLTGLYPTLGKESILPKLHALIDAKVLAPWVAAEILASAK